MHNINANSIVERQQFRNTLQLEEKYRDNVFLYKDRVYSGNLNVLSGAYT